MQTFNILLHQPILLTLSRQLVHIQYEFYICHSKLAYFPPFAICRQPTRRQTNELAPHAYVVCRIWANFGRGIAIWTKNNLSWWKVVCKVENTYCKYLSCAPCCVYFAVKSNKTQSLFSSTMVCRNLKKCNYPYWWHINKY